MAIKSRHHLLPTRCINVPTIMFPVVAPMPNAEPIHEISETVTGKSTGDSEVCNFLIVGANQPMPIPWAIAIRLTGKERSEKVKWNGINLESLLQLNSLINVVRD